MLKLLGEMRLFNLEAAVNRHRTNDARKHGKAKEIFQVNMYQHLLHTIANASEALMLEVDNAYFEQSVPIEAMIDTIPNGTAKYKHDFAVLYKGK